MFVLSVLSSAAYASLAAVVPFFSYRRVSSTEISKGLVLLSVVQLFILF